MQPKSLLPTLEQLYGGDIISKQDANSINYLLNQPPMPEWVKQHPLAKSVRYLPIERVEYLLTRLFTEWRVEIKSVNTIANSVVVLIRLHYRNIHNDEWSWQDGVGACPIQTDSGAGAMDWNKAKSDGVMKAAPAAESYAIKDAAEKLGKIFGKDLNRKDEVGYENLLKSAVNKVDIDKIFNGNE